MRGWHELLQQLRATDLSLDELNGQRVALTLPAAVEPSPLIHVALLEVNGVDWWELTAVVGDKSSLRSDRALEKNATVLPGALCLHRDHYRLRCAHALAHTTWPSFLFYLHKFAAEAADLQQESGYGGA